MQQVTDFRETDKPAKRVTMKLNGALLVFYQDDTFAVFRPTNDGKAVGLVTEPCDQNGLPLNIHLVDILNKFEVHAVPAHLDAEEYMNNPNPEYIIVHSSSAQEALFGLVEQINSGGFNNDNEFLVVI